MPLVRVSVPIHTALSELVDAQETALGRTVTHNQVIEMLVANYRRSVERESEDDTNYGAR